MASLNQCNFIGYAGRDSEMSYTTSGIAVTKFSLAVSDYAGKDKDGSPTYKTTWFNVVVWNGMAESVNKFVTKGGQYFVSGRLSIRNYTDRNNQDRTAVEVIAATVTPLGKAPANGQAPAATAAASTDIDDKLGELDDHPF